MYCTKLQFCLHSIRGYGKAVYIYKLVHQIYCILSLYALILYKVPVESVCMYS